MENQCCSKTTGLALGTLFAVLHTLGLIGMYMGLMGYWQKIHFVSVQYTMQKFSVLTFINGLLFAFIAGYVIGWAFVYFYNCYAGCNSSMPVKTKTKKARR